MQLGENPPAKKQEISIRTASCERSAPRRRLVVMAAGDYLSHGDIQRLLGQRPRFVLGLDHALLKS